MTSPKAQIILPKDFTLPHTLSRLAPSSPILVGFSGGADSSALLDILVEYGKKYDAHIYAAHINHGIRGEEADRDELFCRERCQSLGVELFVLRADVPSIARDLGESIETAARRVRYDFFSSIMKEKDIRILATAHNANDNLETIVFNLARGTALSGLMGIPQTRECKEGVIVRPILKMTREDILSYCEKKGLSFVCDSTNTDTEYTRNKIRAEIIPRLCEINTEAVKNAARLSSALRADSECLNDMTDRFLNESRQENAIALKKLNDAPQAISTRAIVETYKRISGYQSLERVHVDAVSELSAKAVAHSSVDLPHGIEAVIENGCLEIRKKKTRAQIPHYSVFLCEGKNEISQTNCEIIIGYSQNAKNIYKKSILLSIDSAKINGELFARQRSSGDRVLSGGMHKSVKKLMCDKKIPLDLRERLPIICDGDGIVAIPYVALRDGVKAAANTEKPIIINISFI